MYKFNRYLRQINLTGVGYTGQEKLSNARVLCIGAGGLGSPLLLYLAAAGVGTLGIIDPDKIELSNLHRQVLYHQQHIGHEKSDIAKKQILSINSSIIVNSYSDHFAHHNADELVNQYDVIADCTDNFATRYLINDTCFKLGKPYVFASVSQFEGLCSTFLGKQGPCYRCLFPSISRNHNILDCNEAGVLGVTPGFIGIIQAGEIIKWILQLGELLVGRVLSVDLFKLTFHEFYLSADLSCLICRDYSMITNTDKTDRCLMNSSNFNDLVISQQELRQLLENNHDFQLIDVRTAHKHENFNIGGKLIPLEELSNRLNEVDRNKLIVTYCTTGRSSMRALELLLRMGFNNVKSLEGGMSAWLVNRN